MLNYFSIASFLAFFFCAYSIYIVLKISHKSPVTILFSIYLACFGIWNLGYFFIYSEPNKEVVWFWYYFTALGWIPAQFVKLIFYIYMTKNDLLKKYIAFIIPAAVFPIWMFYVLFTDTLLVKDFMMTSLGNIEIIDPKSFGVSFIPLYSLINTVISIILLVWGIVTVKRREIRAGFSVLIISNILMFIFTMGLNILFPILKIRIPSVGAISAVIVPMINLYIIIKHKFFYINLYLFENNKSHNIIENLFDMELIFNSINSGIVVIDTDYNIVRANTYFRKLIGEDIIIGKSKFHELIYGDKSQCRNCMLRMTDGRNMLEKDKCIIKNEHTYFFDIHYFPIIETDKAIAGYIMLYSDTTQIHVQKEIQEDTEKIIRHDLKNYLYSILGFTDLFISKTKFDEKETRELFSLINAQAKKMNYIINSSLTIIKLEKGYYKAADEEVNIYMIVINVVIALESLTKERNVTVNFDDMRKNGDYFTIRGESQLIESMFLNLIKNAVEAAGESSKVVITTDEDDNFIFVNISNNAVVPDELRPVFFNKYSTKKIGGNGLGNYTSMLIAKAHDGDISFTTDEISGTRVTVKLRKELM